MTVVDELPRNEIGKLLRQDLVPLAEADRTRRGIGAGDAAVASPHSS